MKATVKLLIALFASVVLASFACIVLTVIQPIFMTTTRKSNTGASSMSMPASLAVTPLSLSSVTSSTLNNTTGQRNTVKPFSIQPTAVQVQPVVTQPTRSGVPRGTTQPAGGTGTYKTDCNTTECSTSNVTATTTSVPSDPCLTSNGGCSDFCERIGPMAVDCVCPTGRMLQSDMKTCQDCPYGKFGDSCALPCPCDNNATCDAVIGTCVCPASFTGHNCSTSSSTLQCSDGYCQNGGTCSVSISSLTCSCTLLWEGNQCESPRPIPPTCLTLANNQSLNNCLTRFLPNVVSSDDDGASGRDGTSKVNIYIAVGTVIPLVVAALAAAVVLFCRRSSQEYEDTHCGDAYDTSVVYNSGSEQVSRLDSTRNATNSEDSGHSYFLNQLCSNSGVSGAVQEIADRQYIAGVRVDDGSPNVTVSREQPTVLPPSMINNTLHVFSRYQTTSLPATYINCVGNMSQRTCSDAPDSANQQSHITD